MKKMIWLLTIGTTVFVSCKNPDEAGQDKAETLITRQDSVSQKKQTPEEHKPMRTYSAETGGSVEKPGNCAPYDLGLTDSYGDKWFKKNANGSYGTMQVGPVSIEWSSDEPDKAVLRTPRFREAFLIFFKDQGIKNQEQLSQMDDSTFHAIIFPELNNEQRSMLYSRKYNTILGKNEKTKKNFIFVVEKGKSLQEAYAKPLLVIPFYYYSLV